MNTLLHGLLPLTGFEAALGRTADLADGFTQDFSLARRLQHRINMNTMEVIAISDVRPPTPIKINTQGIP